MTAKLGWWKGMRSGGASVAGRAMRRGALSIHDAEGTDAPLPTPVGVREHRPAQRGIEIGEGHIRRGVPLEPRGQMRIARTSGSGISWPRGHAGNGGGMQTNERAVHQRCAQEKAKEGPCRGDTPQRAARRWGDAGKSGIHESAQTTTSSVISENPSGFHEITHGISLHAHLKCHQPTVNRHQGMPKVSRRNLFRFL
jgi:uncharacterized low-complexity protein